MLTTKKPAAVQRGSEGPIVRSVPVAKGATIPVLSSPNPPTSQLAEESSKERNCKQGVGVREGVRTSARRQPLTRTPFL